MTVYPPDAKPVKHPYSDKSMHDLLETFETAVIAYGLSARNDKSHVQMIKQEIMRRYQRSVRHETVNLFSQTL